MKKDKDKKDKDEKDEEEKEEKVELYTVEDTIAYYKKLAGKASAKGDDKGSFRCLQLACFSGMSAIKYITKNPDDGHKRSEELSKEEITELKDFIINTREILDELDFDDPSIKKEFDGMIEHYVKDLKQNLNDSVKAVQTIFYSNWIDDIGDILSNIEEKLIGLEIYDLTKAPTMAELRKERRVQRMMERFDRHDRQKLK